MEKKHNPYSGYVMVDEDGDPIWSTFTRDPTFGGNCCWTFVEDICQCTKCWCPIPPPKPSTTTSTTSATTVPPTTPTTTVPPPIMNVKVDNHANFNIDLFNFEVVACGQTQILTPSFTAPANFNNILITGSKTQLVATSSIDIALQSNAANAGIILRVYYSFNSGAEVLIHTSVNIPNNTGISIPLNTAVGPSGAYSYLRLEFDDGTIPTTLPTTTVPTTTAAPTTIPTTTAAPTTVPTTTVAPETIELIVTRVDIYSQNISVRGSMGQDPSSISYFGLTTATITPASGGQINTTKTYIGGQTVIGLAGDGAGPGDQSLRVKIYYSNNGGTSYTQIVPAPPSPSPGVFISTPITTPVPAVYKIPTASVAPGTRHIIKVEVNFVE